MILPRPQRPPFVISFLLKCVWTSCLFHHIPSRWLATRSRFVYCGFELNVGLCPVNCLTKLPSPALFYRSTLFWIPAFCLLHSCRCEFRFVHSARDPCRSMQIKSPCLLPFACPPQLEVNISRRYSLNL